MLAIRRDSRTDWPFDAAHEPAASSPRAPADCQLQRAPDVAPATHRLGFPARKVAEPKHTLKHPSGKHDIERVGRREINAREKGAFPSTVKISGRKQHHARARALLRRRQRFQEFPRTTRRGKSSRAPNCDRLSGPWKGRSCGGTSVSRSTPRSSQGPSLHNAESPGSEVAERAGLSSEAIRVATALRRAVVRAIYAPFLARSFFNSSHAQSSNSAMNLSRE